MRATVFALFFLMTATVYGAGDLLVTGNIGAGTTTPRAKLDVNGTAIINYVISPSAYVDLAKGLTPTITAGSLLDGGPSFRGDNSCWKILSFPASMTVDLGSVAYGHYINYITFGTHWKEDIRHAPYDYVLDYSNDGISWTNIETVTGNTNLHIAHPFSATWARYIRLTVNAPQPGETQTNIAGLQVLSRKHGELAQKEPWAVNGNNASIALTGNVGIGAASPAAKLEVNGGIRINTTTSKSACTDSTRGTFWVTKSAAGVKDLVEVCTKDETDSYAWRVVW